MASTNPFHYGTPVEGKQFFGRDREVAAVVSRVRDHINVVLLSPRRYGKTSLLLRAEAELAPTHAAIVHVNLLRCRDRAALAGALASSAYRIRGGRWHRARQAVPEFLRRLRVTPSVSFDGAGAPVFSFSPSITGREADPVIADVFAILSEEARRRPATIVLDEFQAAIDLDEQLPAILKGIVDEHPTVSLVTAGSKQHLMERLFVERGAPLFNTAERIALGALPDDETVAYLVRRAASAGKRMSSAVSHLIAKTAGPVPDDIQHLAYETFESASGSEVTAADVAAGLSGAVGRLDHIYSGFYELLSPGQRKVVRQLAIAPTSAPASAGFVQRSGLANASSVRKALDALVAAELVAERGGSRQVADPFFAAWLRGTGPNQ
jgi:uncharacterized protein